VGGKSYKMQKEKNDIMSKIIFHSLKLKVFKDWDLAFYGSPFNDLSIRIKDHCLQFDETNKWLVMIDNDKDYDNHLFYFHRDIS
jgi:hypothetical protein